jgi:hypothetical protein
MGGASEGHEKDGWHHKKSIELTPLGVYRTGLFDEGAVEISAYDPESRRAFMTFASQPRLDVVDLSDPAHPVFAFSIDLTPWHQHAKFRRGAWYRGVRGSGRGGRSVCPG